MALDSERSEALPTGWLAGLRSVAGDAAGFIATTARRLAATARRGLERARKTLAARTEGASHIARRLGKRASRVLTPVERWFRRQPIVRFVSGSLLRRILLSNLIGFFILVLGILYLGWVNTWLIDAKVDALKTQGKIIAETVVRERITLDPDQIPDATTTGNRFPDDGLAALELSIHPEEVTPVLRRLIQPTDTRARIYARNGTLIVDTERNLASLTAKLHEPASNGSDRAKPQNFWTRLTRYLFKEPLPVYQEIDAANGMAYPEVRDALAGNERSMLLLNKKGEQIVSMAVPIRRFGNVQGVLLLSTRPGQIDKILRGERRVILTLSAIALLASVVTSLLLARTVAGPMRRLSAAAEQVSRNIAARAQLPALSDRSDEVGQMAGAFQSMTVALYRRIAASERFAADVAHELKNPLTAARSTAESLSFAKTDAERDHLVQQIQGELKRLNRLITDVSNASRLDAELARKEMRPVDVTVMLRSVVGIFRDILGDDSRRVVLAASRGPHVDLTVNGDEGRLGQVLTNLIDNAVSFSPEKGAVTVSARRTGRHIEITVDDEGPGIPEDRLQIIFDRFYSDRPATDASRGKNSGLGLSISRDIVHSHGGEIVAQNLYADSSGGGGVVGARFIVRLPVAGQTQRGGAPGGRRG